MTSVKRLLGALHSPTRRYSCNRCYDSGVVEVDLDDDRLPACGPCQDCRAWCAVCKEWRKKNHVCTAAGERLIVKDLSI